MSRLALVLAIAGTLGCESPAIVVMDGAVPGVDGGTPAPRGATHFASAPFSWPVPPRDGAARPVLVWTRDPITRRVHGASTSPHWLV